MQHETDPNATRDRLVREWNIAQYNLRLAKDAELKARMAWVSHQYSEGTTDLRGTMTCELGGGYAVKTAFTQNMTVPSADNGQEVRNICYKLCQAFGAEGEEIANALFRWKPEVNSKVYDQLSPSAKRLVNQVITTKPGLPSVEFVEPTEGL